MFWPRLINRPADVEGCVLGCETGERAGSAFCQDGNLRRLEQGTEYFFSSMDGRRYRNGVWCAHDKDVKVWVLYNVGRREEVLYR